MSQIPFVSLLNFYHRYSKSAKRLFLFLWICAAAGIIWWVFGTYQAPAGGISYSLSEDTEASTVVWNQTSDTHALFHLKANAYARFALLIPGFIVPSQMSILVLLGFYLLGWAAVLTAAGKMKSYWNLAPPFLFAVWLRLGNAGELLAGTDPFYLVTLSICLLFFAPLYFFQHQGRQWSTAAQFVIFLSMLALLMLSVWLSAGNAGLYQFHAGVFSLQYIIACLTLIYVSREPLNLVTALMNNRPDQNRRSSFAVMMITWVFILGFLLYLALQFTGFLAAPAGWILPVAIAAIALLAYPFTAQHGYHSVVSLYGGNIGYSLNMLASMIFTAGFFAYAADSGSLLLLHQADRIITFIFPLMVFLQIIYWMVNFYPQIRDRQNVYFILMMPPRIRFLIVWMVILVVTGIVEGRKNWKTLQIMSSGDQAQTADMFLISGDQTSALKHYQSAISMAAGDPKSNYNAGLLMLQPGKDPGPALGRLQTPSSVYAEFSAGDLQSAVYYAFTGKYKAAIDLLKKSQAQDPYVANYLAWLYLKTAQPDSAILALQQALLQDASFAEAYSNLGLVYLKYGRLEEAETFLNIAAESAEDNPAPVANLLYMHLLRGDSAELVWKDNWISESAGNAFLNNAMIWCSRQGNYDAADAAGKILEARNNSTDQLLYKMVRCMQTDSVAQALSRYTFLSRSYPYMIPVAAHNMGVLYYQAGVPEMALKFFEDAAGMDSPQDKILSGIVLAAQGSQDSAYRLFSQVRGISPEWNESGRKECALLLLANGQEMYAKSDWDFTGANYQDWIRGAEYAAASGNEAWLTEMLRKAIEADSSAWKPYQMLAQWQLERGDTAALQTCQDGLLVFPDNAPLSIEYLRACRKFGRNTEYTALRSKISQPDTLQAYWNLFRAEEEIYQKNFPEAERILLHWLEEYPLDVQALTLLGNLWQLSGEPQKAAEYFFTAISLNDRNPQLWLYYSAFSAAAGLSEQAGFGALQAERLSRDEKRKAYIRETFTAEIQAWRDAQL